MDSDPDVKKIGGLVRKSAANSADESISIVIDARWGAGKTTLMATVLDWEDIKIPKLFVMDSEGGLRPVRSRGSAIDYVSVMKFPDVEAVLADLEKGGAKEFGAISMDNLSEVADLSMEETLQDQGKDEPDWEAWRFNSRKVVVRVVRKMRNIGRKYGIPVIFTLWDREETNDQGTVTAVRADLNPALRKLTLAAVDLVCWEEIMRDNESRALHLTAGRRTDSKFRLDMALDSDRSIPTHLYNPSLAPILDTIVSGKMWPNPNPHAFPEGMSPRWKRAEEPKKEVAPTKRNRDQAPSPRG